jgi:hypothetical protein
MSRLDSMARFDETVEEAEVVGECACGCDGEITAGEYVIETNDGDIVLEDHWNDYVDKTYVIRKFYIE